MSQPAILPGALVGRDRELGFLQEFFQQTAVSGGALFLSGDPGVGKTALLNVLAGSVSASGTMVVRVAGAEFEGEISFTGLNQAPPFSHAIGGQWLLRPRHPGDGRSHRRVRLPASGQMLAVRVT